MYALTITEMVSCFLLVGRLGFFIGNKSQSQLTNVRSDVHLPGTLGNHIFTIVMCACNVVQYVVHVFMWYHTCMMETVHLP